MVERSPPSTSTIFDSRHREGSTDPTPCTSTPTTRRQHSRDGLRYETDLTDAEWRVAEAVARGLSNKEIAAELKLSLRTIEGHISRILDKKNLSNRVELALHVRGRKQSD